MSHAFPFGDKREVELPEFLQVKMLKPKVLTEILGQAISGGVMSSLWVCCKLFKQKKLERDQK